jgi:hypothetical protein
MGGQPFTLLLPLVSLVLLGLGRVPASSCSGALQQSLESLRHFLILPVERYQNQHPQDDDSLVMNLWDLEPSGFTSCRVGSLGFLCW